MNESLIGEEVTMSAPSSVDLATLVHGAVNAFLEAAGSESEIDTDTSGQIARACERLRGQGGDGELVARLVVVDSGIDVHLGRADDGDGTTTVHCRC